MGKPAISHDARVSKEGETRGVLQHSIDRPSLSMRRAFRSALIYLSIASPISCSLSPVRIASFFHSAGIRLWSLIAVTVAVAIAVASSDTSRSTLYKNPPVVLNLRLRVYSRMYMKLRITQLLQRSCNKSEL